MSNQSPNPEGQERVVLWRWKNRGDGNPGEWASTDETPSGRFPNVEYVTALILPDDAVCVVLTRDSAERLLLAHRCYYSTEDSPDTAALRSALRGEGEG